MPGQQRAWRVSALFPVLSALSWWEDAAVESSRKQPSGCLMKSYPMLPQQLKWSACWIRSV